MPIRSYRSPKVVLRSTEAKGKGIFAKAAIKGGEVVAVKAGHILNDTQLRKIRTSIGDYDLQISEHLSLSPITKREVADTAVFINHSCDPNVGVEGQVVFVALRDIAAGEELCYDYAMTTTHKYTLRCNCGTRLCRKVITGDDWKRKDLQRRYGSHFSTFILKRIRGL